VADRIVMLHHGRPSFDGTADEIRKSADPYVHNFVEGKALPQELQDLD
jgi:ABC-type transporter Mla maintaining outer membrane lipid asymmetry ATPase subunit MlaF